MASSNEPKTESSSRKPLKLHKPILSLDRGTTSPRSPKSSGNHKSQTSVFARLQAHFLPHVASPPPPVVLTKNEPLPEPPFVKIRIITWNMNESLPKGDLAPLLGTIPPYEIDSSARINMAIPGLSLEPDHLYHIIAVTGQECPTLMGLPLGLGGGMKWDKDEDDKKKDKKEEDKRKKDNQTSVELLVTPTSQGSRTPTASGARTPSRHHHHIHHNVGWSTILQDYFSRGVGSIRGARPDIKRLLSSQYPLSTLSSPERTRHTPATDDKEARWTVPSEGGEMPKVGPYELLAKERMMGIYLAVYVHRDIRPLVEGFSQSSVAAGLMGGRLGNKGGVAISLKLNGTTFLFLGAHLAAHEDKAALRISNMLKIKSELAVDDFLPENDERKKSQDPTDRFDHTFLCGDLNFRLDITRLHAEWLINRREYAQAQEFDQLRKIMNSKGTHAFEGFHEAVIDFPPTFKYDILQTLKGSKRGKRGEKSKQRALSEVEERAQEEVGSATPLNNHEGTPPNGDCAESDCNSSVYAEESSSSSGEDEEEAGGEYAGNVELGKKAKHVAEEVKRRWFHFLKSTISLPARTSPSVRTPDEKERKMASSTSNIHFSSQQSSSVITSSTAPKAPPIATRMTTSMDVPRRSEMDSRQTKQLTRSSTSASAVVSKGTESGEALHIADKGVYDTSSKQRVPSWCDRILFKSTVPISPSPIEIVPPSTPIVGDSKSRPNTPHRGGIVKIGSLLQALNPRSRSGSSPTIGTRGTTSSTGTEVAAPVPVSRSAANSQAYGPLRIVTNLGREEDSPIEIPTAASPEPGKISVIEKEETGDQKIRSATVPDMARAGSTISDRVTTLRLQGRRRRSLSATLPRTTEPIELIGKGIPASVSTPPVIPLLLPDGKDSVGRSASRVGKSDAPVGRGLGLRRIMSIIPGSWGHPQPSATAAPDTSQSLVSQGPPLRVYKKGEVRCLGYQTLSDREMRRLEGRSDHRPVIGHFAVYV